MRFYNVMIIVIILISISSWSNADDLDPHYKFSGVKAPESPYKNTWGAFQTNLFSGSFGYDYKISVPPGTNGLEPKLSITYNSHSARGKASWVGAGWDIPLSYIQRDIEYTRKDTIDDSFDLYFDGAKHDLVRVSSEDRYHTKIESYMKIEQKKTGAPNEKGEYWVVTTTDGTEYRFGHNEDSENMLRATDTSFTQSTQYVWRWSLDRIKDSNGNCIYFTYTEDQGSVYLSKIEYNNEKKRVVDFILEDKPDEYLIIDQGSEILDAFRLKEIHVSINDSLIKKYVLDYEMNETGSKSLLKSITEYGSDGITSLPPVRFEYSDPVKGFNNEMRWTTPERKPIRKIDTHANDTIGDTFDVNGDGLPDLISYNPVSLNTWEVWLNMKDGFSSTSQQWPVPTNWAIRDLNRTLDHDKQIQAPTTRSCPMDINGDGYIDFLYRDGSGALKIRKNSGSSFLNSPDWGVPSGAWIRDVQKPDGVAANVIQNFFDMNGDNLPDLVRKENDTSWHVWRNTGNGFVDYGIWPVPHNYAWIEDFTRGSANLQVGHFDVNGDGLPDIVNPKGPNNGVSEWQVYLNTGSDFIAVDVWRAEIDSDLIDNVGSTGNVNRDFFDINGDGLPDIVNACTNDDESCSNCGGWEVQFNKGKGFTPKMCWQVPNSGYIRHITEDNENSDYSNTEDDILDIDGDGSIDLARGESGYWRVYTNKSGQADLLIKVTDTLGGTVSVSYTSSMKFDNSRLPFNFWVVSSVTTNNGMTGAHLLSSTTGYSYAMGLYDFPTREFRGFEQVSETKADGSKVIHSYYQDEAKKGNEHRTETKDASNHIYSAEVKSWDATTANGIFVNNLERSDDITYDGIETSPKTIRKEYHDYDSYGNVGLSINYGDLDTSGDEVLTYNEYLPPCETGAWITDKVKHSYLTATENGPKLRESLFFYDNNNSCPEHGDVTYEEHYLKGGAGPVTRYEYDSYGNRTKTTDPEGRVTTVEYDTMSNTYPYKITNALNQVTTKIYNHANGEIEQNLDPNGYTTNYEFDVFNRKIKEIKPYDSSALPTTSTQYLIDGTAPEFVIVSKRENAGETGTLDTIQSIDGFGNLIQSKTEYEDPSAMIATDVFYDVMGRVSAQSNSYITDNTYGYSTPDTNVGAILYSYDPVGRPVRISNPDGTVISRVFDHWTVSETDENGHTKTYTFDFANRLKQVIERNKAESYTTSYSYNTLGELTGITDHSGNSTEITYDMLGRKILMTDPDMGTWLYDYDNAGNMTMQIDARGVTTSIRYDSLNRKTLIDYPDSTDVVFKYDENTIGTLSSVADDSGTVNYVYDHRLRKVQEDRFLDSYSWTTKWAYDSMDRVTKMTYPDNESVDFAYNSMGKLKSIPDILTGMAYNATGQITEKKYSNGITTAFTYNPLNQRLTGISSSGLQDLSYTYDNAGNIKSITDAVTGRTERFDYDDLDRLVTAGDNTYSSQYQYNAIGNMTAVTRDGLTRQFTYGANNEHPHAVTGILSQVPVVGAFVINSGDPDTTSNIVTLDNISYAQPTQYIASENKDFSGASWRTYSENPSFLLSAGYGIKTIYLKIRNTDGESKVKTDTITFKLDENDVLIDDDNDGLLDAWEIKYFGDLDTADSTTNNDSDDLLDKDEFAYGTDPKKQDTDGDGDSDSDEVYYGTDPTLITDNLNSHRPAKPVVADILTEVIPFQESSFEVNKFADPDENSGDYLAISEWQISLNNSFDADQLVYWKEFIGGEGGPSDEKSLCSLNLPAGILMKNKVYWIRSRHYDSVGLISEWSEPKSFKTVSTDPNDVDEDGIKDTCQIDGFIDTNENGVNDRTEGIQPVYDAEDGHKVGIQANDGNLSNLSTLSQNQIPTDILPNDPMPYGLFNFRVDGLPVDQNNPASVDITFYLEEALSANTKWYKYDAIDETMVEMTSSISISGNVVTLTITDGGIGDMDGVVNGVIIDPSGPAFTLTSSPPPDVGDSGGGGSSSDSNSTDTDGGGGGGGVFGAISLKDVTGYHFDWINKNGIAVYMPVTEPYKALKGAQTHLEGFAPGLASIIRKSFDALEGRSKKNPDGFWSKTGTYLFPVLGKIAEFYLDIVGKKEFMKNAYSKTTISIKEFNELHREGKAISSHVVKGDSE